jgi:hypothetical protein
MSKQKRSSKKFGTVKIFVIIGVVLIGAAVGYSVFNSMIPTNRSFPILGVPENTYLTAQYSPQTGYVFASKSTTSGKKSLGGTHVTPEIHLTKNQLGSIHFINEDTGAKHNLNIDEFNVHTRDLGYFETQTSTFVADKGGTFKYYCSLHPEMSGTIIVE